VALLGLFAASAGSGCHLIFEFEIDPPDAAGGDMVAVSDGAVDGDTAPDDTAPSDTAPSDTAPREAVSTDAGPADAQVDLPAPDSAIWSPPGTWVTLNPGSFIMGSPTSELCRDAGEVQHQVTLTRYLQIQDTEVTQEQYLQMMGFNPTQNTYCGLQCAADGISFHYAAAYCNALSTKAGLSKCYDCKNSGAKVTCTVLNVYAGTKTYSCNGYRLPTEAEWEYAYRAGTSSAFYSGAITVPKDKCGDKTIIDPNADAIGWYKANMTGAAPAKPMLKQANKWGLFDMAGNLWEWCHDHTMSYTTKPATDPVGNTAATVRIVRGGSWASPAAWLRAAERQALGVNMKGGTNGFRCVRNVP